MQHSYSVEVWQRNWFLTWGQSLIKEVIENQQDRAKNPQKLKNNNNKRDFCSSPVVNTTICSGCRRYRFNLIFPGRGTESPLPHSATLKKLKRKEGRLVPGLFVYLFYFWLCWSFGLCCFHVAFSSWGEQELPCIVVCGLLVEMTSFVAEHRL